MLSVSSIVEQMSTSRPLSGLTFTLPPVKATMLSNGHTPSLLFEAKLPMDQASTRIIRELDWVALLVADSPLLNSTTGQNTPIFNTPPYIAVPF